MPENADAGNNCAPEVEVVDETPIDAHVVDLTIRTSTIGRDARVRLITPKGWKPRPERNWPTVYLLHGGDDGPECWTDKTDVVERVVASDVLAVLPDCGRAGFFTDWRAPDAAGTAPQWETFGTRQLQELIESRYGGSSVRAVAGVSMGGYAALTWAARNPGRYAAAASYSGMVHITRRGTPTLLRVYLRSVGERMAAMWGSPRAYRDVWERNDPYLMVHGLEGTEVYLSAGNAQRWPDDPRAPFERIYERLVGPLTLDLANRAANSGVNVNLSYGNGTHAWPSWCREIDLSWPFLIRALASKMTD